MELYVTMKKIKPRKFLSYETDIDNFENFLLNVVCETSRKDALKYENRLTHNQ